MINTLLSYITKVSTSRLSLTLLCATLILKMCTFHICYIVFGIEIFLNIIITCILFVQSFFFFNLTQKQYQIINYAQINNLK